MTDAVILSLDLGTTHCKAGVFRLDGTAVRIVSLPMITHQSKHHTAYFDPAEVIQLVNTIIQQATEGLTEHVAAVGIASMAESGLLIDRASGNPLTRIIPWFETSSQPFAEQIINHSNPLECYQKFGLQVSFKCSLTKILWLQHTKRHNLDSSLWLSMADFIAHWLSGAYGTDYSLAGRTMAFRVDTKHWDADWLKNWGLHASIFPPANPSGTPIGTTQHAIGGLPVGTPVAICGHDHVCAAFATGGSNQELIFDSMGTAETLVGALPERSLTVEDFDNGLQYGCHISPGMAYWMGGISASGGSVEWLRSLLAPSLVSYAALEQLLARASSTPTRILYFPYLWGSGSPHIDSKARGAFIGLTAAHRQEDFFKAVLEGISFEMEFIRRAGEKMMSGAINTLIAAGGGTRYREWMQIKADVSGCQIKVSANPEATLLGAALAVGIGSGLYTDEHSAFSALKPQPLETFLPNAVNHEIYQHLYENGFLPLQDPLREYYRSVRMDTQPPANFDDERNLL